LIKPLTIGKLPDFTKPKRSDGLCFFNSASATSLISFNGTFEGDCYLLALSAFSLPALPFTGFFSVGYEPSFEDLQPISVSRIS
jgi:hypothetical protein